MTVSVGMLLALVWVHLFADFFLQTDKMAISKSSSNAWLSVHVGVYTIPLFLFGWKFALLNGTLHWITDFFSSRATTKLWKKGDAIEKARTAPGATEEDKNKHNPYRHWFFAVIGVDQAVHMTCLILTIPLIGW